MCKKFIDIMQQHLNLTKCNKGATSVIRTPHGSYKTAIMKAYEHIPFEYSSFGMAINACEDIAVVRVQLVQYIRCCRPILLNDEL